MQLNVCPLNRGNISLLGTVYCRTLRTQLVDQFFKATE